MANRLADETSPYLRQHADNPVDWYPWGDEAFDEARRRDVPVLLSVGYSSCHWCHVMAHESFEDDDTAALMNERFVNVKVDREERPDVDAVYMDAVQAISGRGGWPMTVFLAPDGRPFFGGTYFPKQARGGMPSFTELCRRIDELWRTQRRDLVEQAEELTEALGRSAELAPSEVVPGAELLAAALDGLVAQFDPVWGGFGAAPKFPAAMNLDLLARIHVAAGSPQALEVLVTTLDAMAAGGIYDHLGGGFARYSVDERWLVPHFEKMLYDQALLVRAYLRGWQLTGSSDHLAVLDETIAYLARDLRTPGGAFASAEDADSEGVEGRFYVWDRSEVRSVLTEAGLGPAEIDRVESWWGITDEPSFEVGSILHRPERGDLARPPEVERARVALLARRDGRVRPGLDDKVLTEWNALLIAALAEAAAATGRRDWLELAVDAADHLLASLRRPDGRWLRSWQAADIAGDDPRAGEARHLAYAADHAALVDAFTRLAEATGEARWIVEARATADALLALFWDDEHGGVFTTGTDAEALVARPKELTDGATPSANALTAVALARLAALTGEDRYRQRAEDVVRLVGPLAVRHPTAFGHLLGAVDLLSAGPTEVAITGDRPDLVEVVTSRFRPTTVLAWGEPYPSPLWEGRDAGPEGRGQAFVCRDFACRAPVSTPAALAAELGDG